MILLGVLLGVLVIVVLLIYWVRLLIKTSKENKLKPKRKRPIRLDSFQTNQIHSQLYQLLECVELIENSKNLDIVIGRFDFVKMLKSNLSKYVSNPTYNKIFYRVIDEYKTNYYDRTVSEMQVFFCENPKAEEQFEVFYSVNLLRSLSVASQKHLEAIDGMKQAKAIYNRYQKIIDLINVTILEIKKLELIEDKETTLLDLEGFKKEIIKKTR